MKTLRAVWAGVQAVLHFIGRIMTVVLLTITYIVVVVPWGAVLALAGRRPLYAGQPQGSTWRDCRVADTSSEEASRPY